MQPSLRQAGYPRFVVLQRTAVENQADRVENQADRVDSRPTASTLAPLDLPFRAGSTRPRGPTHAPPHHIHHLVGEGVGVS